MPARLHKESSIFLVYAQFIALFIDPGTRPAICIMKDKQCQGGVQVAAQKRHNSEQE